MPSSMDVHAIWASHTGYRHVMVGDTDIPFQSLREEDILIALEWLYKRNAELPWLVGREHEDMGWKLIEWDKGCWRIRVPDWAHASILDAIRDNGWRLQNRANNWWALEIMDKSKLPLSDLKKALAPILRPGSRLADQEALASELRASLSATCASQLDLFDNQAFPSC